MMRTFNLFLILCALSWAAPTFAQTNPSGEETTEQRSEPSFQELVSSAQKAYSEERYDQAIDDLVHAYSMRSNARLLFNLAKSYENKDKCAAALVYYRAYVNHPANEKELIDAAEKQMKTAGDCPDYSSDLAGRLSVDTTPHGAEVTVDGESYGRTPTEVVPLDSGTHKLVIELKGYQSVEIDLQLEPGKPRTIDQILQEEQKTEPPKPPKDEPEAPKRQSIFWPIHPAALALGSGGIAGLAVGGVYDLILIPNTDDKRQQAKDQGDNNRFRQLTDRRDTQRTVALIGYVGGGLLLASGITWHVIDVTSNRGAETSRAGDSPEPVVTFGVGPRSVQFGLRF